MGPTPQRYALGSPGKKEPQQIPWGYGQNRITAMPVDPARMYVYWEITDEAIEKAREALGPRGRDAWLNLRVYDITGRIFDGTNAHGYFDHRIERHDRHWFFHVGKPTSTACVELGLKSDEGYFVKVTRSGRVDFPRTEAALWNEPQWLTVFSGKVGASHTGGPGGPRARGPVQLAGGAPGETGWFGGEVWEHSAIHRIVGHMLTGRWEWHQILRGGVFGEHAIEWVGPLTRTTWEAGPFTYPVDLPVYVEERAGGEAMVHTEGGVVHVLFGPWQVIIRGIDARLERRILATWEMYYSWVVHATAEPMVESTAVAPGASERLLRGASERHWMGASELRMRGASEVFRLGASEIRFLGATETLFRGASERRLMGASEYMYRGASEYAYRGASEQRFMGASEQRFMGASELGFKGASERMFPGASEGFAGASERRWAEQNQDGAFPSPTAPKTLPDK